MTKTQTESKSTQSIESLIKSASALGTQTVPESTSVLEEQLITVMKNNSDKWYTAKEMFGIFKVRNSKYFSDKMWQLANKKNVLIQHKTRGFYKFNTERIEE